MKKLFIMMMAITISVAFFHSAAPAGSTRMTTEELTELISGNTVYGTNTKGKEFIQIFATDGSIESGLADNRGSDGKWKAFEHGTWKVKKGKLCNKYTKPKKRSGGCDKFYKTDDGKYFYKTSSGGKGTFDQIVPGRAE